MKREWLPSVLGLVCWSLVGMGCRGPASSGPADIGADPAPSESSVQPMAKTEDGRSETRPGADRRAPAEAAPEAEPVSEAEPAPLIAPDGTVIEPCGETPEGMACVPGGPFIRGADDGPRNAQPAETVWLQTYYMDLFEVTYADYKACQKSKACLRGGPLYNDFSRPNQPIVGPSWFAAVRYCEVAGKHLPTEAQWEKAARGPDGALYPWGDEVATCERAVIKDKRGRSCGVLKKREHPKKGRTFVVGTRPPGAYGLFDMSGNAWEWVFDWASPDYARCGEACRGMDPKGPCEGRPQCRGAEKRVVRGGSWYWDASYATATYRRTHYPINEIQDFHHFGFRCAASLEQGAGLVKALNTPSSDEPTTTAETSR